MSRTHLAMTLVAAGLVTSPAMAAAQELPPHLEEGLFEVVVHTLGAMTVPVLVDTAQTVLLPLDPVLAHVGYEVEVQPLQHVWRAGRAAPDHRLVLDPPRYVDPQGEAVVIPPSAVAEYGGTLYLSTDVLSSILGAEVAVDWSALRVVLTASDPPFPAEVRARVEERRRRLVTPDGDGDGPRIPYASRSGGGIFDWSVSTSPASDRTMARGMLGIAVLGGDLNIGGSAALGNAPDRTAEVTYRRIIPERDWINQLLVGQVVTQDLAPRSIIGVVVSNIPRQRDPLFGEIPVSPDIPEGWEFEVYQSGQLVGFSTVGTDETIMVPVRYGQVPLEVRMVGPAGEEVVSQYRYLVPISNLPAGRTEYSAGGGVCPRQGCDGIGYGEIRHGVGRHLTIGGGVQGVARDGNTQVRPSALLSYLPGRHWSVDMEARAEEFVRGSVDHISDDGRHMGLDASLHQSAFGRPSFLGGEGSRWQLRARTSLRPLNLSGQVDGMTGGGVERVRFSVASSIPRGHGELAFETGSFGPDRLTGRASTALPAGWVFDRPVSVVSSFNATRQGVRLIELSSSLRARPDSYLSAALQWDGNRDALHLSLTFRQVFGGARLNAAAVRRPNNSTLTLSAAGSLALGGQGLHFEDRSLQGRAGVVGRVYYDRDGDQSFGTEDEPAPDVSVLVGGMRVRTDSQGFYRAWNVTPYDITTVSVDTLSGIDPRYTVLSGGVLLRPVPHLPNRVDFPLAETRELLGRVERETGHGIGGVQIEIFHPESGRRQVERTFSDGTFYFSRLLPGEWVVRVTQESLDAVQAVSDPPELILDVDIRDPNPLLEIPPFILRGGSDAPP